MACSDDVFQKTDNWGEQIRCLREEIGNLRNEIDKAGTSAGEFSSKLGSTFNIMKGMTQTINSMLGQMQDFVKSSQQQYDLAEKLAQSYKKTGLAIGISVDRSRGLSQSFKGAAAEVARFGGDIEDVAGIYEDFAESSGRVRILGKGEVSNIFELGKAANLVGSEATNLYETLELMGVSNEAATERMNKTIISAQQMGLNSSKVMKVMSNNMKTMQTYSFVGGVKGMTEMAKQAVKMRIEVSDVLQMADKFYQPEAAIEAAANLQMLGGDIAEAFGDPFETMYLARNKPEELAKRLEDMTANMLQFNEVTGEYELPAEARMQLKSAGDQLGISVDKMVELARQSSKIKDVKDQLSMSGIFSEEEMEGIAAMSRMEGGEFKVDVYDENGEKVSKSIDDLTSGDVEMLMKTPPDEEEYMTRMLDNSMTTNELLRAQNDSFQKAFIEEFDIYKMYEDSSKETLAATRDLTMRAIGDALDTSKDTLFGEIGDMTMEGLKKLDQKMADAIGGMSRLDEGIDINSSGEIIISSNATSRNTSEDETTETSHNTSEDFLSRNDGRHNRFTTQDDVLGAKKGGVIDKMLDQAIGNNNVSNNVPSNVNLNGEIRITGAAGAIASIKAPELRKMVIDIINQKDRNGGTISSKQVYDS